MARNQKQQREASEFEERVVYINRVSKTVKGGRRMSLVALVVVGDGKGTAGKANGQDRLVSILFRGAIQAQSQFPAGLRYRVPAHGAKSLLG